MSEADFGHPSMHRRQSDNQFDGKKPRSQINRKIYDYNSILLNYVENRKYKRNPIRDREYLPNVDSYYQKALPPMGFKQSPVSSITSRNGKTSTNKDKCPVNVLRWTPDARRVITGISSGEFTLWNGTGFNFETIQQAHKSAVRAMTWSHNESFMITADNDGTVRVWKPNMMEIKSIQAHQNQINDLSFAPTDAKFVTCSEDTLLKVYDFKTADLESSFQGHGSDVKACEWHPYNSLIASGSKDYLVKIWDAKSNKNVITLHSHKNTVCQTKWNKNGNWLITSSRDQLIKLHDIRFMKEFMTFRGHKREVTSLAWHPFHEKLFATGGHDGPLMFWLVGNDKPLAEIPNAHDKMILTLDWHPLGHILCSGSNDSKIRFWLRNKPELNTEQKPHVSTLPPNVLPDNKVHDMAIGSGSPPYEPNIQQPRYSNPQQQTIPGLQSFDTSFLNNSLPGNNQSSIPGIGVTSRNQHAYSYNNNNNTMNNYTGGNMHHMHPPGMHQSNDTRPPGFENMN